MYCVIATMNVSVSPQLQRPRPIRRRLKMTCSVLNGSEAPQLSDMGGVSANDQPLHCFEVVLQSQRLGVVSNSQSQSNSSEAFLRKKYTLRPIDIFLGFCLYSK